ncbi:class I SAM-dependent methyltransferase [Streptomyces sp. 5.8]|uniref:class I SAM-dependent methyltransferase n=1 Tax=Streptomyces sp. 5.8 TaxID=3406571 RepID=UPI003BB6DC1F
MLERSGTQGRFGRSVPMLERVRESARVEGTANASFTQGDAQSHPFAPGTFDVAIIRYGVMSFADPVAAFANIASALCPGGRLAFVCPAEAGGNEWLQALAALHGILPVGEFGARDPPGCSRSPTRSTPSGSFSPPSSRRPGRYASTRTGPRAATLRTPPRSFWDPAPADTSSTRSGPRNRSWLAERSPDVLRPHQREDAVLLRSSSWLVTARRPAR